MSDVTATAPSSVSISQRAKEEIRSLALDGAFLRIWVTEGGCSGMTYQASMDETRTPFDVVVYDQDGVTLLADRNSAEHLLQLDVDYSDDLVTMGFRFSNPNATKACGCGASFAL
jgi:iron-sulfur cluster assembly accessory protein